jgi:hypothetical protein
MIAVLFSNALIGALIATPIVLLWVFANRKNWLGFWLTLGLTVSLGFVAGSVALMNWLYAMASAA